jgi:hypothetical protein
MAWRFGVEENRTGGLKLTAEKTRATTAAPFHRFDVNKANWHQYNSSCLLTSLLVGNSGARCLECTFLLQPHRAPYSAIYSPSWLSYIKLRGLKCLPHFKSQFCFETMKCQHMIQNLKSHKTKKQRVSNLNPSFVLYRSMSQWLIMSKRREKQKTCLQRRGGRL